jgi:hypothetical protein
MCCQRVNAFSSRAEIMRAVVFRRFGPAEVLEQAAVGTPRAGQGEVLVQVAAVSVGRLLDLTARAGASVRCSTAPSPSATPRTRTGIWRTTAILGALPELDSRVTGRLDGSPSVPRSDGNEPISAGEQGR